MVRYIDDSGNTLDPKSGIDSTQADKSREEHLYSDVDTSREAQHHTIGKNPTQAAAGNHNHDSRYSMSQHSHTSDDLPPVVIPDEVVVSPTEPDEPEEGQLWIDSSIPDARVIGMRAVWESDTNNINSTTFSHPAKWGMPVFTAPADGLLAIWANCNFDNSGLLNNRSALWRLRVYDSTDTLVKGNLVEDDRTRSFTLDNHVIAPVVEGETYTIRLEFALSHANGTVFVVSEPVLSAIFYPYGDYVDITIETDP